jgi:hypothetical protein
MTTGSSQSRQAAFLEPLGTAGRHYLLSRRPVEAVLGETA